MTRRYEVLLALSAQADLERVYYHIAEDSPTNAAKIVLCLEERICSLREMPERNALIPENEYFGTDYRHLIHKKYRIIYRISDDRVYVVRVVRSAKLLDL